MAAGRRGRGASRAAECGASHGRGPDGHIPPGTVGCHWRLVTSMAQAPRSHAVLCVATFSVSSNPLRAVGPWDSGSCGAQVLVGSHPLVDLGLPTRSLLCLRDRRSSPSRFLSFWSRVEGHQTRACALAWISALGPARTSGSGGKMASLVPAAGCYTPSPQHWWRRRLPSAKCARMQQWLL